MKSVKMRLSEDDMLNVSIIKREYNCENKATAIGSALKLNIDLIDMLKKGRLILEKYDGTRYEVFINGDI